jgi:6-phosphogluconolactonase
MEHRFWTLYVGSYTTSATEGIHSFLFDRETETFKKLGGTSGIENPSYLTLDSDHHHLYSVSEVEEGEVVSFRIEGEQLFEVNRAKTGGSSPCYVEVDDTHLLSVNYMGGNISVHTIERDGRVGQKTDSIQNKGSSTHVTRQEAPHPHTIVKDPNSDYVFVSDLGTDHIHVYSLNHVTGKFQPILSKATQKGAGPRHFAFHPTLPYLFACQELDSTIAVYKWQRDRPTLDFIGAYSTLPASFKGENTTAEIKITKSGNYLYCSNRGHDSLAIFRVQEDGRLVSQSHVSTKGQIPRHFTFLPTEDYLFVANQDSDSIWLFRMGPDGELVETNQSVSVSKPVCVQVVETPKRV